MSESLKFTCEYLLEDENNLIVIHVDQKSDILMFSELEHTRISFLKDRVMIRWGGVSMIEATLHLLKHHKINGYYTLLSGDDFPCVSHDRLTDFFNNLKGESLFHFQDFRNNHVDVYKRFNYLYPNFYFNKDKSALSKALIKIYEKIPFVINKKGRDYLSIKNMKLFKGTQWFSISSASLNKILDFLDRDKVFLELFYGTFCPDEMFFHTLVRYLDIPVYHDKNAVNDCLRYVDWTSGPEYPRNLVVSDFIAIKKSGCLFARKAAAELSQSDFSMLISSVSD